MSSLIACHDCDLLQQEIDLPPSKTARCRRCDALLYRSPRDCLNRSFAFTVAAVLAFLISMLYPLMTLEVRGAFSDTTLIDSVWALYKQNKPFVASLVLVMVIIVPAVNLIARTYLLSALHFGIIPAGLKPAFRLLHATQLWCMTEVFVLSAFVSFAKLINVAEVTIGAGLWAYFTLMLLLAAANATFESRDFWRKVELIQKLGSCQTINYKKIGTYE